MLKNDIDQHILNSSLKDDQMQHKNHRKKVENQSDEREENSSLSHSFPSQDDFYFFICMTCLFYIIAMVSFPNLFRRRLQRRNKSSVKSQKGKLSDISILDEMMENGDALLSLSTSDAVWGYDEHLETLEQHLISFENEAARFSSYSTPLHGNECDLEQECNWSTKTLLKEQVQQHEKNSNSRRFLKKIKSVPELFFCKISQQRRYHYLANIKGSKTNKRVDSKTSDANHTSQGQSDTPDTIKTSSTQNDVSFTSNKNALDYYDNYVKDRREVVYLSATSSPVCSALNDSTNFVEIDSSEILAANTEDIGSLRTAVRHENKEISKVQQETPQAQNVMLFSRDVIGLELVRFDEKVTVQSVDKDSILKNGNVILGVGGICVAEVPLVIVLNAMVNGAERGGMQVSVAHPSPTCFVKTPQSHEKGNSEPNTPKEYRVSLKPSQSPLDSKNQTITSCDQKISQKQINDAIRPFSLTPLKRMTPKKLFTASPNSVSPISCDSNMWEMERSTYTMVERVIGIPVDSTDLGIEFQSCCITDATSSEKLTFCIVVGVTDALLKGSLQIGDCITAIENVGVRNRVADDVYAMMETFMMEKEGNGGKFVNVTVLSGNNAFLEMINQSSLEGMEEV